MGTRPSPSECSGATVPPMRGELAALAAIAEHHGGACLWEGRLTPTSIVRWQCAQGHVWETMPSVVIGGAWCPECEPRRKRRRWSIELMQAIARERGGACLSTEYRHFSEPLRWRCAKGHVWDAKPGGVVNNGAWCRRCAGKEKHTLVEVRALARERGGECLSTEYVNLSTPLRWRCKRGHEWRAAFGNVRSGSWCPKCAVRNPLSIDEMRAVTRSRGGACLSTDYVNPRVKLRGVAPRGTSGTRRGTPWRARGSGAGCARGASMTGSSGCARSRESAEASASPNATRASTRRWAGSAPRATPGARRSTTSKRTDRGAPPAPTRATRAWHRSVVLRREAAASSCPPTSRASTRLRAGAAPTGTSSGCRSRACWPARGAAGAKAARSRPDRWRHGFVRGAGVARTTSPWTTS